MDASAWDARYDREDLVWTAEPNRFVVAELGGLAPGRALDVACGEGRNAVWLATRRWTVTGVDFSSVALAKGRGLADAQHVEVTWVLADLTAYEPEPGAYDLVVVLYLQLPAAERSTVLRAAGVAVAPGGTLLVVAHDSTNLVDGYGGPKDASVLYTHDDVVADLAPVEGLRVEKAERVRRPVATDDGMRDAIDCLVRATRTTRVE